MSPRPQREPANAPDSVDSSGPLARALSCQPPAALARVTGEHRPVQARLCYSHLGPWQAFAPRQEKQQSLLPW